MRRSPWFNARRDPPVNGGPDALYEHRCAHLGLQRVTKERARDISHSGLHCPRCEWRGVLKEEEK